jgi:hypothetical protein
MTKVTSMNTYLEDLISKTPVNRLVLELENINTHKLNDEVILGCDELRQFYIQKQQLIIHHLSQMLMKDAEYED